MKETITNTLTVPECKLSLKFSVSSISAETHCLMTSLECSVQFPIFTREAASKYSYARTRTMANSRISSFVRYDIRQK